MTRTLKKVSVAVGLFLLAVSIFWSQDGFNFDIAGDSGYGTMALIVGWGLGISVSVVQFVFSTNYKYLNPSLILFGILAYAYSIYTNAQGIIHFQGENVNRIGAWILGFVMDGVPEPLIAWGLNESLTGDFVGNLIKAVIGDNKSSENQKSKFQPDIPEWAKTFNLPEDRPERGHRKSGKRKHAIR